MILYVNGDSHSAGAELVHLHGKSLIFREDDATEWRVIGTIAGRNPHPECLKHSYGQLLANKIDAEFICDAVSASSNDRILRTTYEYLKHSFPKYVVIGWSTWEREEWYHEATDRYWQVNAGGIGDDWPTEFKERYKDYILNVDYKKKLNDTHEKIWELHKHLDILGISHVFFNTFGSLANASKQYDWGDQYLDPYSTDCTYFEWLKNQGFRTVSPDSFHYGPDAHKAWAELLYQKYFINWLTRNK